MHRAAVQEYHWLTPSELALDGDPPSRRSVRDWLVDAAAFLLALAIAAADALGQTGVDLAHGAALMSWLNWLDLSIGGLTCLALWWRRRWPVHLTVITLPLSAVFGTTTIVQLMLLFTVAVRRRFAVAGTLALLALLAAQFYPLLRTDRHLHWVAGMLPTAVCIVIVLLWGMFVRARRQLVLSLRERAKRAETEQQLREEQAQQRERTRIAREMHDVLAHRISLLTLHAGALEVHQQAPPDVTRAAGVIRDNARRAMEDLREVIGVLRDLPTNGPPANGAGLAAPERPQPTLGDVPQLVDESRAAGCRVVLREDIPVGAAVPVAIGRTAYRIVQEGLTNARKHALGTQVTVSVRGAPGTGLSIEVTNPPPVGRADAPLIPGTGTGLIGLAERASLAGGRLDHGRGPDGSFTLRAWLPWSA